MEMNALLQKTTTTTPSVVTDKSTSVSSTVGTRNDNAKDSPNQTLSVAELASQPVPVKGNKLVPANGVVTANDAARRRVESNLAAIMMGYVLVFLICHAPRLLLNIHELANIREAGSNQKK